MSIHGPQKSTIGPNARGEHPGHPNREPEILFVVHHSQDRKFELDQSADKGMARASTAHKGARAVGFHNGMSAQQVFNATSEAANASKRALTHGYDPTEKAERVKMLPPPKLHDGMTDQQRAGAMLNGEAVLSEAKHDGADFAHGIVGRLPDATTEETS